MKSPPKFKLTPENSRQNLLSNLNSSRGLEENSNKLKRFKSEHKIVSGNILKASDGETAYTQSPFDVKKSNMGSHVSSPKNTCHIEDKSKGTRAKWIEESSFFLNGEESDKDKGEKPTKK